MRVLVCGGRDYADRDCVYQVLDELHGQSVLTCVIHGGASGADDLADDWVEDVGIERMPFPVSKEEWATYGKAAGPIRNQRMLDEGKPDLVVAFPGGRGTADMVRRAEAAGVKVVRITDDRLPPVYQSPIVKYVPTDWRDEGRVAPLEFPEDSK